MNTVHTDLRGKNIGYGWDTEQNNEISIRIHNESDLLTITWTIDQFQDFIAKSMSKLQDMGE